jgi:hypothetical protein
MLPPKTLREWAAALICSVVFSVAGGAYLLHWLGLADIATHGPGSLAVLLGTSFACGTPGWVLVRSLFRWFEKRDGRDIAELAADAAHDVRAVVQGAKEVKP